jgi:hypothetical protein
MSGLTPLTLRNTGVKPGDMTPEVRVVFDFGRQRRGWPSLVLNRL